MDTSTGKAEPIRLYDVRAIEIATFVGSCFAGGFLISRNFKALGKPEEARYALGFGFLGLLVVLLIGTSIVVPKSSEGSFNWLIVLLQTLALRFIALHFNGKAIEGHRKANGIFFSRWRAAGIALLLLPALFAVALAIFVLFPNMPAFRE